jgi:hypothetical protein
MTNVRWEDDTRGRGVGDASRFADGASELLEAMRTEDWIAEDPELHLLPHLRAALEQLPLELGETGALDDGTYEVELDWMGAGGSIGEIRRAVYALVGDVSETATYVRQRGGVDGLTFEVVTGFVGDDSHFAPHGHALRLRVALP